MKKRLFGVNSRFFLEKYLKRLKKKQILLVRSRNSFFKNGGYDLIQSLNKSYNFFHFFNFSNNITLSEAKKGKEYFLKNKCELILSIGGGSAIDMGKMINYLKNFFFDEKEVLTSKKKISVVPHIVLPTTSGTGSEETHFATVYHKNKKYSVQNNSLNPRIVIIDPCFTYILPKKLTACTALDALCQSIESYWSINSNKQSKLFASRSIKLVLENINNAFNSSNKIAREKLALAANYSGRAINISKTTAPHALSYAISNKFKIEHGHAVALTLGKFLKLNYYFAKESNDKNKNKILKNLRTIYSFFGVKNPEEAENKWLELLSKLELESDLEKIGINNSKIINYLINNVNLERLSNHPVRMNRENLTKIFTN